MKKLVFLFFNSKNVDDDEVAFFEMVDDITAVSSDEEDSNFEYY